MTAATCLGLNLEALAKLRIVVDCEFVSPTQRYVQTILDVFVGSLALALRVCEMVWVLVVDLHTALMTRECHLRPALKWIDHVICDIMLPISYS